MQMTRLHGRWAGGSRVSQLSFVCPVGSVDATWRERALTNRLRWVVKRGLLNVHMRCKSSSMIFISSRRLI